MIKRLFKKMTRLSLVAAAIGAVVYFLDPRSGRDRRSSAKDQLQSRLRGVDEQDEHPTPDVANKVEGFPQAARKPGGDAPDDKTLVDKIKSEILGRSEYENDDVLVDAVGGVVTLRGQLQRPEQIDDLGAAVGAVPGVSRVENYLHLPGSPAPNKEDSLDA